MKSKPFNILAHLTKNSEITFAKVIPYLTDPSLVINILYDDGVQFMLLQSLINSHHLSAQIYLVPYDYSDFLKLLKTSKLLLLTNINTTTIHLKDSLSVGCPIMMVTHIDYPLHPLIQHGKNGYVVDENNTTEITKVLKLLINDHELLTLISTNALKTTTNNSKQKSPISMVAVEDDSVVTAQAKKTASLFGLIKNNSLNLQDYWAKNHTNNPIFTNTIILSITDGNHRAKVIEVLVDFIDDWDVIATQVQNIINENQDKFYLPVKWIRLEWISGSRATTLGELSKELMTRYKRNYFRSGIAIKDKKDKSWLLSTEMELNANACLYEGGDIKYANVNESNFSAFLSKKYGKTSLPTFHDDMEVWLFNTVGCFIDLEEGCCHKLANKRREWGKRELAPLNSQNIIEFISKGTDYLAHQIKPNGQYSYGYFPCFDNLIPTYNVLRHSSSTYSLLESYEWGRDNQVFDNQTLDYLQHQITSSLIYVQNQHIRYYGDKAYVVDINEEIKLGANATCILAMAKFTQIFNNDVFVPLMRDIALGMRAMQQSTGQFVHVLHASNLKVKDSFRVLYYEGEATFSLLRLYAITKNPLLLTSVEKALDYYIEVYPNGHDHWLSYTANEIVKYLPKRKYFQFGINNITNYLDYIKERLTTFPTLLELSMAFHHLLVKLAQYPEYTDLLNDFDIEKFYDALHTRANYLLNGFFFPEVAMYYKAPHKIVNSFFIRHHAFRVRIDDVEHYLSGLIAYDRLLNEAGFSPQIRVRSYSNTL